MMIFKGKRGAADWTVRKTITLVLLLILASLVIYGFSIRGANPLKERTSVAFEWVLSFFKKGEAESISNCVNKSLLDVYGGPELLEDLGIPKEKQKDAWISVCLKNNKPFCTLDIGKGPFGEDFAFDADYGRFYDGKIGRISPSRWFMDGESGKISFSGPGGSGVLSKLVLGTARDGGPGAYFEEKSQRGVKYDIKFGEQNRRYYFKDISELKNAEEEWEVYWSGIRKLTDAGLIEKYKYKEGSYAVFYVFRDWRGRVAYVLGGEEAKFFWRNGYWQIDGFSNGFLEWLKEDDKFFKPEAYPVSVGRLNIDDYVFKKIYKFARRGVNDYEVYFRDSRPLYRGQGIAYAIDREDGFGLIKNKVDEGQLDENEIEDLKKAFWRLKLKDFLKDSFSKEDEKKLDEIVLSSIKNKEKIMGKRVLWGYEWASPIAAPELGPIFPILTARIGGKVYGIYPDYPGREGFYGWKGYPLNMPKDKSLFYPPFTLAVKEGSFWRYLDYSSPYHKDFKSPGKKFWKIYRIEEFLKKRC